MASPPRSRRVASKAKAASFGKKRRSPSPSKAKAGKTSASSSGKRNAIPKAKQNAKALPRQEATQRGKGSRKSKKTPGKPRTVNLADRQSLLGRYQTGDYLVDILDEIRQDIAGLRSDVQDLRENGRVAGRDAALATLFDREARRVRRWLLRELSGGERDQNRTGEGADEVTRPDTATFPPEKLHGTQNTVVEVQGSDEQIGDLSRIKNARANHELLKQQTKCVDSDTENGKRVSLASLETLLVEMLVAGSHDAAKKPTAFRSELAERTVRKARKLLYDNGFISANITTRTKKMHAKHGGKSQMQEYWSDVRLTKPGAGLAQHIHGLGLPHLKHVGMNGNKVEAMGAATGSTDGPKKET